MKNMMTRKEKEDMAGLGLIDENIETYLIQVNNNHFVTIYEDNYEMTWLKDYALQFDTEEEANKIKKFLIDNNEFSGKNLTVVSYSNARNH